MSFQTEKPFADSLPKVYGPRLWHSFKTHFSQFDLLRKLVEWPLASELIKMSGKSEARV